LAIIAFGLNETRLFKEAEQCARKALEINSMDVWSVHALAHVLEELGRQDEGITMLRSRESDWVQGGFLSCHLYWHWALHLLELGQHQAVFDMFDKEILTRCTSTAPLDLVDVR
jgi:hypothetical protein